MRLLPLVAAAAIATTTACGQSAPDGAVLAPDPPGAVTALKLPTDPEKVPRGGPPLAPGLAELANRVAPSLVDVTAYQASDPVKVGTGIVLNSSGLVLTNEHVIADGRTFRITAFSGGQTYPAALIGADPAHDLALIRIQKPANLQVATMGDSDRVRVGDLVASIGNGYGRGSGPAR